MAGASLGNRANSGHLQEGNAHLFAAGAYLGAWASG